MSFSNHNCNQDYLKLFIVNFKRYQLLIISYQLPITTVH